MRLTLIPWESIWSLYDADYWASKRAKIERAALAADPAQA
jgi:hypothetical protein